jgi:phage baseplate assembly protein gpV
MFNTVANNAKSTPEYHEHLVVTIANRELQKIRDLHIEQRINDHARISFSARVVGETQDKEAYIKSLGLQSKIVVGIKKIQQINQLVRQKLDQANNGPGRQNQSTGEAGGELQLIFKGLLTKVDLRYFRDEYLLTVEGVSYSYLLDLELRKQSFQKAVMTYTELVDQVLDNPKYRECQPNRVILETLQKAALGQIKVQYNETDWQFLVRMAAQNYTGLVANPAPNCDADKAKIEFWFGVPEIDSEVNLQSVFYKVCKKIAANQEAIQNKTIDSLNQLDCLEFEVNGIDRYLQIGQTVSLNGQKLYVCQVTSRNDGEQLWHDYRLTGRDGLKQPHFYNPRLAGVSLTGIVIDWVNDEVKVFFDVDQKQSVDDAWLFPQLTAYTAEGHTGWYWMPEIGDQVKVYFPDGNEANAYIVSSLRKSGTSETTDPDKKYFRTPRRKTMLFDSVGITVSTTKGTFTETDPATGKKTSKEAGSNLTLRLDQGQGIQISSDHTLNVNAAGDMTIDAKTMKISAGKLLKLKCKESCIKMEKKIIEVAGKLIDMPKNAPEAKKVETVSTITPTSVQKPTSTSTRPSENKANKNQHCHRHDEFLKELEQFPEDYRPALEKLHNKHVEWRFEAYKTGVDFEKFVDAQAVPAMKTTPESKYFKIPKSILRDNGGYYDASRKAIAYFADPRNFLTESQVFQFLSAKYNPAYKDIEKKGFLMF